LQIFKGGAANLQILELNPQLQIRKFLRYASSQILNPQISFDWSTNRKSANFLGDPVRKWHIGQFSTIRQRE
jgi:hypothetical protein